jgi:hypothetical protein
MNTHHIITALAMLSLGSAATTAAEQNHTELKQHLLAQAQSLRADDYAFTRTIRSEAQWNSRTFSNVTVERFDPTKPMNERWTLLSVDAAAPSRAQLNKYRKEAAKRRVVPGYHRLANYIGAPASVSGAPDGKTLLHLDALPKGSVSILETDLSKLATAHVSVATVDGAPLVEQVRITIAPQRARLLFKIHGYESTSHYRIGADRKPLLASTATDMSGSGMGVKGTLHSVTTYTDYQPVRNSVAAVK